jgi:hypothetical protein
VTAESAIAADHNSSRPEQQRQQQRVNQRDKPAGTRAASSDSDITQESYLPDTPAALFATFFFCMPPATLSPLPDMMLKLQVCPLNDIDREYKRIQENSETDETAAPLC